MPPRSLRNKAIKVEVKEEIGAVAVEATTTTTGRPRRAAAVVKKEAEVAVKRKAESEDESDEADEDVKEEEPAPECDSCSEDKPAKKTPSKKPARATKKSKTTTSATDSGMGGPLAPRTAISSLKRAVYIGAHVSAAGGVHNAVANATHVGANAFALFLKSQRKWENPALAPSVRDQFRSMAREAGYDAARHCLPHGSYLVNLAQPDAEKADKAYANFIDDLKRCDELGIALYNFHPGSALTDTKAAAISRIAAQLNRAHKETKSVVTVIENMAGAGNIVGDRFEDLRDIIALVDDKARVGVCLDTCHAFAAGYDLRTQETFDATMAEFDRVVGVKRYLRALHLNDSKAPLASNRDLHANIGTGFLGLRAFHAVVNYKGFEGLPMVLETPIDVKGPDGKTVEDRQVWADEIKLLESLVDMDPESKEFEEKAEELQRVGAGERKRMQEQVDKKAGAAKKAATKKGAVKKTAGTVKKRGKKKVESQDEDESDCV